MKKISLCILVLMLSLPNISQAVTYTWNTYVAGNLTYTNGNMSSVITGTAFDTRGPQDPNGGTSSGYKSPKYVSTSTISTYQGGFTNDYGMQGLVLGQDWSNLTSSTVATITFAVPIGGPVSFNIYDINQGSGGGYTPTFWDKVTITGTNCGGTVVYPTISGCGNSVSGANSNIISGGLGCTNTTNTVTFNSPSIKTITITYSSGSPLASGYGTDPDPQYIIVSDITASTWTLLNITTPTPSITCAASTATLSASSSVSGTTYSWAGPNSSSPAGTTPTASSTQVSAAGTYTVTATDPASGCTASASVVVSQSGTPPGASIAAPATITCSSPSVTLTASSGTAGVTYLWSGGGSAATKAVTAAGTYTVTVTNPSSGCTSTASVTVSQNNTAPNVSLAPPATLTCTNTTVTLNASSSTAGVTYGWSGGGTGSTKNVTAAGSYTVTATDPTNGCTAVASVTVTQVTTPPNLSVAPPATLTCTNTSVTLNASSSTAGVTYGWSGGGTGNSKTVTTPGTYTVTATDPSNSCTISSSVTVSQNTTAPNLSIAPPATLTCTNTSVTLSASSSTGGVTYSWSGGGTGSTKTVSTTGTYTVTATDPSNGCTSSSSVTVSQNNTAPSVSIATPATLTCTVTSVTLTASSVTAGATYAWSGGGTGTTKSVSAGGTYTVTVTNPANGCTASSSVSVTQNNTAPNVSIAPPATINCSNTSVTLTASSSTAGVTYSWSGGGTGSTKSVSSAGSYAVTATDPSNGCTAATAVLVSQNGTLPNVSIATPSSLTCTTTSVTLTASSSTAGATYNWGGGILTASNTASTAGNYTVTVTDPSNNCTAAASVNVPQNTTVPNISIAPPAQLTCTVTSVTLTASSTTSGASYAWSGGGTGNTKTVTAPGSYTVTATDPSNGCTASGNTTVSSTGTPVAIIANQINENCNGGNTGKIVLSVSGGVLPYSYVWSPNVSVVDSAVNLTAGAYSVTVRDGAGCQALVSTTITEPTALSASVASGNASCGQSNGWAQIIVSGGTVNYSYLWSVAQSTDSITGLAGNTYYVTVTDNGGCQFIDSVVVGTNNGPNTPTVTAGGPTTFCQGGNVVLTSSAATGNVWSTGETTQSITVSTTGSYTVTQTTSGCTSPSSSTVSVTVNPTPAAPTISASGATAICQGTSVVLTSSASSGNVWSDNETTQSITVSSAGTYTVSITQNGCSSPAAAPVTVTITPAPQPQITASQQAICAGSSVTLDASTAAATAYLWSNASTQPPITISSAGSYKVTVTVNGCTGVDSITINAMPQLGGLSLQDTFAVCDGDSVVLDASTANATSYLWSAGGATTALLTARNEGAYYVTVSNSCGSVIDSTHLSFKDCNCKIVMPNAFTPNADSKNETFGPNFKCTNPKYLLMRIFNRWGEKIFETNDLYGRWDGSYKNTQQPPGVYVYYVEFVGAENTAEKTTQLMGSVTLIR